MVFDIIAVRCGLYASLECSEQMTSSELLRFTLLSEVVSSMNTTVSSLLSFRSRVNSVLLIVNEVGGL